MGDSFGAGIVNHLSRAELAKLPQAIPLENCGDKGKPEENDVQL